MIMLNIHAAKTHLSRYLARVKKGEEIVLCNRNVPVARIVPLETPRRKSPRPIGLARGSFSVPASFFEELPEEVLASFEGA